MTGLGPLFEQCLPSACMVERDDIIGARVGVLMGQAADGGVFHFFPPDEVASVDAICRHLKISVSQPTSTKDLEVKDGDHVIYLTVEGLPQIESGKTHGNEAIEKATFTIIDHRVIVKSR